jgi:hypothetical protein
MIDFDDWFEDYQDLYQLQQFREARACASSAWDENQAEIERLNEFIDKAFQAHPNLDIDVENVEASDE